MLKNLIIKNIVLIDETNIDFKEGLSVLTGETGSGKSILLDALSLAIGVRSSSKLLRNGEKQGSVIATFTMEGNQVCRDILEENAIDFDEEIVLKRVLFADGKSKAFINGEPITQNILNKIGESLIEIHGQGDQIGLLNPSFHREILDEYGNLREQKRIVSDIFIQMNDVEKNYLEYLNNKNAIEKEKDYLESVLQEISNMSVRVGEEEELADKRIKMMNREKIVDILKLVKNNLDGGNSVGKIFASTQGSLGKNSSLGQDLLEEGENVFELIIDDIERSSLELNEALNRVEMVFENLDFEGETLDEVEERLFAIRGLARKYNILPDYIFTFLQEVKEKLKIAENVNLELGDLEVKLKTLKANYKKEAELLSSQRKVAAGILKDEVEQELKPLKMDRVVFETEFMPLNEGNWTKHGLDSIRFVASTNVGTNLDNLAKIASGGELSRFMLALKVVLSKIKSVPTLIFDEIDTGISGAVADAVGERIKKLGEKNQVLIITHLAQVASKGDNHLKISKQHTEDSTRTIVENLNPNERRIEIAKIISGEKITDEALRMADKLLNN